MSASRATRKPGPDEDGSKPTVGSTSPGDGSLDRPRERAYAPPMRRISVDELVGRLEHEVRGREHLLKKVLEED